MARCNGRTHVDFEAWDVLEGSAFIAWELCGKRHIVG